jgi:hypothetical protein
VKDKCSDATISILPINDMEYNILSGDTITLTTIEDFGLSQS